MQNTVVQARVNAAAKAKAEAILSELGITLSDGIRMFISQVGIERGIPFKPSLTKEPSEHLASALQDVIENNKTVKFSDVDEAMAYLDR